MSPLAVRVRIPGPTSDSKSTAICSICKKIYLQASKQVLFGAVIGGHTPHCVFSVFAKKLWDLNRAYHGKSAVMAVRPASWRQVGGCPGRPTRGVSGEGRKREWRVGECRAVCSTVRVLPGFKLDLVLRSKDWTTVAVPRRQ